jgi:SAM-dependent methyltransferase
MARTLKERLFINSSRHYLELFASEAGKAMSDDSLVLDAGAGNCVYQKHFSQHRYESADFCQIDKRYGEITYVCDLSEIPVDDSRYDMVFFSQTLEHLPEPGKVINELIRVLKPGGQLWLSVPLFYAEHEIPHDYFRYTQYGLRHLLESRGLHIEKIEWLEGYYGTLSYQMRMASTQLPKSPASYGGGIRGIFGAALALFLKPFFALLTWHFGKLDLRHRETSRGMCKNYKVVARK